MEFKQNDRAIADQNYLSQLNIEQGTPKLDLRSKRIRRLHGEYVSNLFNEVSHRLIAGYWLLATGCWSLAES